ncbi:hypothetical protein GCM10028813_46930 [Ramlibacter alkalitolerans]
MQEDRDPAIAFGGVGKRRAAHAASMVQRGQKGPGGSADRGPTTLSRGGGDNLHKPRALGLSKDMKQVSGQLYAAYQPIALGNQVAMAGNENTSTIPSSCSPTKGTTPV